MNAEQDDNSARFGGRSIVPARRTGNLIAEEIRQAIVEGRIAPGETLREEELARELGTSRTPIREALIELRNEDLLESQVTRRAVVRAYTDDELLDMYGLRATLEGHATRLATERATRDVLDQLEASVDRYRTVLEQDEPSVELLFDENLNFHWLLADTANVPRLRKYIDQVMFIPRRYRGWAYEDADHRRTVLDHHQDIVDAVVARDPDLAATKMTEHVQWTGRIALAAQATLPPPPPN